MNRKRIAQTFGRAAASYDLHSDTQRHAADRLAGLIAARPLPPHPRVLEIGCGTGHLTERLARRLAGADPGNAASHDFFVSDIAPAMAAACRARLPGVHYLVMDGERPAVAGPFDLICANLAAQWFTDLAGTADRLTRLLAPGGLLALSLVGDETFREWRAAHAAEGLTPGTRAFVAPPLLRAAFPAGALEIVEESHVERPASALDFLRALRAIGADTPAPGHRPLAAGQLRAVLRRLGERPTVTYHLLYALWSAQ